MRVRAIMTPAKELTVLNPTDTAKHAIELIEANGFLSLPVAEGTNFVGFLSKQFIYDVYFKERNHTEVMGIQEISIRLEGKDIDKIVKKLEEKGFKVREFIR